MKEIILRKRCFRLIDNLFQHKLFFPFVSKSKPQKWVHLWTPWKVLPWEWLNRLHPCWRLHILYRKIFRLLEIFFTKSKYSTVIDLFNFLGHIGNSFVFTRSTFMWYKTESMVHSVKIACLPGIQIPGDRGAYPRGVHSSRWPPGVQLPNLVMVNQQRSIKEQGISACR